MITKYFDFLFENKRIKMKLDLPQDIYDIKKEYDKNGKKLYVVGGCVRDFVQKLQPHDIDLVTDALPEESINFLKDKFKVSNEQGKSFGVIRVYTESEPLGYEIATFRRDLSKGRDTKGEGQKVEMGKHITIEDDVNRRDFKMNALFYDIDNEEVIDLVGGLDDIENNRVSAVGEPEKRFEEDRLRLLRLIRFSIRNLSEIDKKTSDAVIRDHRLRNISEIDDVSQERIYDEFKKSVDWCQAHDNYKSLTYYFELLKKYSLFEEMFPDVKIDIDNIKSFNLSIIFALLFRDNNTLDLSNKLRDFKIPNNISDKILFLIDLKNNIENIEKIPELNKKRKQINIENSVIKEYLDYFSLDKKYINCFLKYNPIIKGEELLSQGIKGIEIGKEIRKREIAEFKKLLNESVTTKDLEIDDYVIGEDECEDMLLNSILFNNIGQIIGFDKNNTVNVKYDRDVIKIVSDIKPMNIYENYYIFYECEIKYCSKNKEDLQQIIDANKFGL